MLSRNTRTICSFCKENGHTLKSCKTLAAVECKYCHELGHTTKHCHKLATKHHRRRRRTFKVINLLPEHADGFKTPKKTAKAFRQKNHPAKISSRNHLPVLHPIRPPISRHQPRNKNFTENGRNHSLLEYRRKRQHAIHQMMTFSAVASKTGSFRNQRRLLSKNSLPIAFLSLSIMKKKILSGNRRKTKISRETLCRKLGRCRRR